MNCDLFAWEEHDDFWFENVWTFFLNAATASFTGRTFFVPLTSGSKAGTRRVETGCERCFANCSECWKPSDTLARLNGRSAPDHPPLSALDTGTCERRHGRAVTSFGITIQ